MRLIAKIITWPIFIFSSINSLVGAFKGAAAVKGLFSLDAIELHWDQIYAFLFCISLVALLFIHAEFFIYIKRHCDEKWRRDWNTNSIAAVSYILERSVFGVGIAGADARVSSIRAIVNSIKNSSLRVAWVNDDRVVEIPKGVIQKTKFSMGPDGQSVRAFLPDNTTRQLFFDRNELKRLWPSNGTYPD